MRAGMALYRGLFVPSPGRSIVLRTAPPLVVHEPKKVLRGSIPLGGGLFIPFSGLGVILRHALPFVVHEPEVDLRIRIARDINDHGQIALEASRGNIFQGGKFVGVLLTPVNPTMTMEQPDPGLAGTSNTIPVTGATPGATVRFFYSLRGGGAIIPGCATLTNALQLAAPQLIGSAVADQNGVATITRTVPPVARGQTILFQAVVQSECAISQLVMHRFE